MAGCAAAWPREETSEWTQRMRAHTLCRDVDGWAAGTTFLKQMRLLQDTLVPPVEHRSGAITVVRRPFKVGSMRTNGQRRVEMTTLSYMTPAWEFIVLSPPYLRLPLVDLPRTSITARHKHRTASCPVWSCGRLTSRLLGTRADVPRGTRPGLDECVSGRMTERRVRVGRRRVTGPGARLGGRPSVRWVGVSVV